METVGRLPDAIIGGAPRSGTSWLHTVLAAHPGSYVPVPFKPEPKFFLVDSEYARGLAYYSARWFAEVPGDVVACEKSANYLESPVAARRIAADLPAVRMVFILREPAERARSNYLWSRMNGLETEDFPVALELEADRERNYPEAFRFSRPHSYFSRGLYAQHLSPYLELLGRERILVLRHEDISTAPERVAAQFLQFLGAEPLCVDARALGRINESDAPEGDNEYPDTVHELRARYREPNAELRSLLGDDFPGWEDAS